jgi:hypothetical protein
VINWPAQAVLESVDILVFQYQELLNPAMAASRDAYVAAVRKTLRILCAILY